MIDSQIHIYYMDKNQYIKKLELLLGRIYKFYGARYKTITFKQVSELREVKHITDEITRLENTRVNREKNFRIAVTTDTIEHYNYMWKKHKL